MKRQFLVLILVVGLYSPQISLASASVKVGSSCAIVNQLIKSGSRVLVCSKVKSKLNWKVATAAQTSKYYKEINTIANTAAELKAKQEAEAKAAAELKAKQEADAKAAAELKVTQEAEAKAAAELKVTQEAEAKAAADKVAADFIRAANALSCATKGESCQIGDIGPGGGIVFYDEGSQQSWGRYLEFAPVGWSGSMNDPKVTWCNLTGVYLTGTIKDVTYITKLGVEIGKGKTNTALMSSSCTSGAGILTTLYHGGGKTDWFLPSRDELNELCKFARNQVTGDPNVRCIRDGELRNEFSLNSFYWSSSEINAISAWQQYFGSGNQNDIFKDYSANDYQIRARPIRSF